MSSYFFKPVLRDLSQGSRIAFAREFRYLTQDNVSDKLGLTGECKRRSMARYERGDRVPKDERLPDTVEPEEPRKEGCDSVQPVGGLSGFP